MTDNPFRTAITKAITDQNKTYRDVARDTGISHTMIYFYVSGLKDITSDKLIKLCESLSIKIEINKPSNNVDIDKKILYWAKQMEHKSLSIDDLVKNAKFLIDNI